MRVVPLLKGLGTYIPGLYRSRAQRLQGSISARYCYSLWLRHAVALQEAGMWAQPAAVAELGPGPSLGAGIAAMLLGARSYVALDTVAYVERKRNLAVFEAIAGLVRARAPIPPDSEFPELRPRLASFDFPSGVFPDERIAEALSHERLERVRAGLADTSKPTSAVRYQAPWIDAATIERGSQDLVFSQAVLEHVDDLRGAYAALFGWLRPGGVMSHVIDFRCHGLSREWNGHWTYGMRTWKFVRGRRPYFLNRAPLSTHVDLMRSAGFEIRVIETEKGVGGLGRRNLAAPFRDMNDQDIETCAAFIAAVRP